MNEETLALANAINRSLINYRDLKIRLPSISDNILYEYLDSIKLRIKYREFPWRCGTKRWVCQHPVTKRFGVGDTPIKAYEDYQFLIKSTL